MSIPPGAARVAARVALSASFLSAVADRFGIWGPAGTPGVAWGNYGAFVEYTESLLGFLPSSVAQAAAGVATLLEVMLSLLLLASVQQKPVALGSCLLLVSFALSMSLSRGPKVALDYSVWSAASAALLLAQSKGRSK